ncbi:MAG: transcription antitermination factor NusB [bacterium]|nr:transcription antitermination factor NusB [bacterium]
MANNYDIYIYFIAKKMKIKRRWARELTLKILYASDITNQIETEDSLEELSWSEDKKVSKSVSIYAQKLVQGIRENASSIDKVISKYSKNWKISRQSVIDRNILRMAVYELIYCLDIPNIVVIDEAIELSKKYSDKDSPSFINGVLDAIRKDYNGCTLGETSKLSNM